MNINNLKNTEVVFLTSFNPEGYKQYAKEWKEFMNKHFVTFYE